MMIWEAALEDTEPGVCVSRCRGNLRQDESIFTIDENKVPLVVYYELPSIFHVNGESRRMARLNVSHQVDSIGACFGAYRAYEPDKDTLLLEIGWGVYYAQNWRAYIKGQHLAILGWHVCCKLRLPFSILAACQESHFYGFRKVTAVESSDFDTNYGPTCPPRLEILDDKSQDITTRTSIESMDGSSQEIGEAAPDVDFGMAVARLVRWGPEPITGRGR